MVYFVLFLDKAADLIDCGILFFLTLMYILVIKYQSKTFDADMKAIE